MYCITVLSLVIHLPSFVAGQCRTDQRYRTDPACRNAANGLKKSTAGKNADAGLPFPRYSYIPAFTYDFSTSYYSYSKNSTSNSRVWTGRVYPSPWLAVRTYVQGVQHLTKDGKSDCPASNQSGAGRNKKADAGNSPVQECMA
jgi:hypothetical protein